MFTHPPSSRGGISFGGNGGACAIPFCACCCDGAWTCEDIYGISLEVIAYYDTNGDG